MRGNYTTVDQSCCVRTGAFRVLVRREVSSYYQPLFDHMADEHGIILIDSEMDEICHVIDRMRGGGKMAAKKKSAAKPAAKPKGKIGKAVKKK